MKSARFRILTAVISLLFQTSCLSVLPRLQPTPTIPVRLPTDVPTLIPSSIPTDKPTSTPTVVLSPTATPFPGPDRVLILSIDGFRPDAIDLAPMPNLQMLLRTSAAYNLKAQTIYRSETLPSHTSMLTGLCPAKHGVDWNDYVPKKGYALGTDIFDLAHAAGLKAVMLISKEKLSQITEPFSLDVYRYLNDRDTVVAQAAAEMIPQGFDLFFIHFRLPDGMGHEYGWLSREYLSVLYRSDEALGTILSALEDANMRDTTLVIVTADHGGHKTTHGTNLPEDMTIPWIMFGPSVVPGPLNTNINTTDTAATTAWALDLPIPPEWDGMPVLEAFGLPDVQHPQPRCATP